MQSARQRVSKRWEATAERRVCSNLSTKKRRKYHCLDGYDSPRVRRLWAISQLSGAAGRWVIVGGGGVGGGGGRGYLRRIRETWWMTQYFHARGKLLHFKLEGVTERDGGREAEEEWNKFAGIKALMRRGGILSLVGESKATGGRIFSLSVY